MSTQIAQTQIELNRKYGKRLIIIAWTIEIVAASIGLFIGISNAQDGSSFYERNKFTNTFIGSAPFIIIAAVELTKIPLAIGVYRVKRFVWRTLFLSTLLLLVFVTFETIFVGLETNFSAREADVQKPRSSLEEKESTLISVEEQLLGVNSRTVEQIDEDFRGKITLLEQESYQRIEDLSKSRKEAIADIQNNINQINSGYASLADATGTQQKVDRLRADISKAENDALTQIQAEREIAAEQIESIEIAIKNIEDNANAQLLNAGRFAKNAIREDAANKTSERRADIKSIEERRDENIRRIEEKLEANLLGKNQELKIAEQDLQKAQSNNSGGREREVSLQRNQIDYQTEYWSGLIDEENSRLEQRISSLENEREELKRVQRVREALIPELEEQIVELKAEIISLRQEIDERALNINVYRVAKRAYGHESASDVAEEELAIVAGIWFGSIAFIAAVVGAVLALAGAVLQDPESYRPIQNKKRPIYNSLRRVLINLRKFYKNRRVGVIRGLLRSAILDFRKYLRAPKIKYVTGPEKLVYKEVPKEIVKSEIVYVPLYSVEDGTVIKEKNMKPKKKDE